MKKLSVILASVLILTCFAACSAKDGSSEPEQSGESVVSALAETEKETATAAATSTTSPKKADESKSEELVNTINTYFDDTGDTYADSCGGFEFRLDDPDESEMYAMEQSDDMQKKAEENAKKFVSSISKYYPYEIKYESTDAQQVGGGDNGIDSAVYIIVYTNVQNQELQIRADSAGEIYYAYCNFTW